MEQAHPPPEQSRRLPDGPLGVSRISHLFIGSDSVRGVIDDGVDIGLDDSLIEQFARLRLVFFSRFTNERHSEWRLLLFPH